jgi:putative transposase
MQLPTGTSLVDSPARTVGAAVASCRVPSAEQRADLERQAGRVGEGCGTRGITFAATIGEVIPNPRHLEVAQRELRRLQRQASRRIGPDRRTRQVPSGWRKTHVRIAGLHTVVANARRDGLHTLTNRLARGHGTIVIEDLNVVGMSRNRRLARHVAGVGMGELRRQVEYKTGWSGVQLHIANRWYPSSTTCSGCGVVKTTLRQSERTYIRGQCGFTLDRDLNAASNLATLVGEVTGCGGGDLRRDSPMETHVRPAPCAQRVLPREGSPGQRPHRKARTQDTVPHVS